MLVKIAAMTTTCPSCQAPLRSQAQFCPRCGQPTAIYAATAITVCPRCQGDTRPGAKFCPYCGYGLLVSDQSDASNARDVHLLIWERRLLLVIATLALLLLLVAGLLWQQSRSVMDSMPIPDIAATLTVQAATPTPLEMPATAVPVLP